MSRVTLAQWQMLAAVVDHGGFARAAEAIHKSPSTLNHAVHKLEELLGVQVLEPVGRQVRLTEAGELLLRRARQLIESASALEDVAGRLAEGLEAEVVLAVDQVFPTDVLARALDEFSEAYPYVRVQLHETVLNGGIEMLYDGSADLVVSGLSAQGFLGEPLLTVRFLAVAHPGHPLQRLGRELDLRDLVQNRQLVVRDSALRQSMDAGWLKAEQRWTVSHLETSIGMVKRGLGFAWLPGSWRRCPWPPAAFARSRRSSSTGTGTVPGRPPGPWPRRWPGRPPAAPPRWIRLSRMVEPRICA